MRVIHDAGATSDTPTIAVLLASEHLIIREGLRKLLEGEPGIVVVGDVADPQEALTVTRAVKPKIVIVAFSGRPLIRTLRSLRQLAPAGDYGRAIVLAARITSKQMTQALQLGVDGILLKDTSARALIDKLHKVAAGESVNGGRDDGGHSEPPPAPRCATVRCSGSAHARSAWPTAKIMARSTSSSITGRLTPNAMRCSTRSSITGRKSCFRCCTGCMKERASFCCPASSHLESAYASLRRRIFCSRANASPRRDAS